MYNVGCMLLRTGIYIMNCLTFQAKLLLYRHYVLVLDLYLDLQNVIQFNFNIFYFLSDSVM
jgi:hypothetical protein